MSDQTITLELTPCEECGNAERLPGHERHYPDGKIPGSTKAAEKRRIAAQANGDGGEATPARRPAPDTSKISLDAIDGAVLASGFLREASAPTRERPEEQKRMDAKARAAYTEWVKLGKPSDWKVCPVVTYFANDAEEVRAYRFLIRRACMVVTPDGDSPGVRARFGHEFTLTEKGAERIGHPELAGKIVITWCAIDKRVRGANGDGENDGDE